MRRLKLLVDDWLFVRSHPEMFLPQDPARSQDLADAMVKGIALTTAQSVEVRQAADGWWVVHCAEDWMKKLGLSPAVVFSRILAFPEAGQNSMRPEVLLKAFAKDVVTVGPDGCEVISGSVPPGSPIWQDLESTRGEGRSVAFRV